MNSIRIHVISHYDRLSQSEQKAADFFLTHIDDIYSMPIATLAEQSGVSPGTWVRFCKSIGFDGLKDLKRMLFDKASELSSGDNDFQDLIFTDIKDHRSTEHIIDSVQASSIQAITNTLQILDRKQLEQAAEAMFKADSVRIFGVGASGLVGLDLAHKLMRIGLDAVFSADFHIQLTYAATMHQGDFAVIISNSGITREMIEIQNILRGRGVKNLVLTQIGKNHLSEYATYVLTTSSPEIHRRSGAMSSRIAQLVLVDCLFITLANSHYTAIEGNLEASYDSSLPHRVIL